MFPDIRAASGSEFFVLQQDSAPSHRAEDTVALLDPETPDFKSPALWPRSSPHLNLVDYTVCMECASGASHTVSYCVGGSISIILYVNWHFSTFLLKVYSGTIL